MNKSWTNNYWGLSQTLGFQKQVTIGNKSDIKITQAECRINCKHREFKRRSTKQIRSLSCESEATTTAGSGAAFTAGTNFFEGSSVKACCITIKRLLAAASRLTATGNFLESMIFFPLEFDICFSSLGRSPGADALIIPPKACDIDETMCFGPSLVVHFSFIFNFVLDQVGEMEYLS